MRLTVILRPIGCCLIFLLGFLPGIFGQQLLLKPVTIEVRNEPLGKVLDKISGQYDFYFSYNATLISKDSIVSLSVSQVPLKQVLDKLFKGRIGYRETSGYIILQAATPASIWYVSGTIVDAQTGERLENVSIYERVHLAGTITDDKGYFRLALKEKNKYPAALEICASRVSYSDTCVLVNSGYDQEFALSINPVESALETVIVSPGIQRSGLARLFISSRLKKQSANLRNFLASRPYQFSLTPGLGTHGELGAQVINSFSFNVLGGYTAGVNGFELAGLFNINKKSVSKVQVAGLFNVVGGNVDGLQIGGIHNKVLGSVNGMQVGGITNQVAGDMNGMQVSGILSDIGGAANGMVVAGIRSDIKGSITGWQVSGIMSSVAEDIDGVQVSGIASIVNGEAEGIQIAGIVNRARHLKGWQIGLVNLSDTASGYSIGLLNINRKGYHTFSFSSGDLLDGNFTYRAGNRNFYVILSGGLNLFKEKAYGWGYGLGNHTVLSSRLNLLNEIIVQQFYNGNWKGLPLAASIRPALGYTFARKLSIYGGPTFSLGFPADNNVEGFNPVIPSKGLFGNSNHRGWIGWQLGISTGFKSSARNKS